MEDDKRIESLYYSELFGVFLIVGMSRFRHAYYLSGTRDLPIEARAGLTVEVGNLKKILIEQKFEYLGIL